MSLLKAFAIVFVIVSVMPICLQAQDTPPPRCCPRSPGSMGENTGSASIQADIVISTALLKTRQTTQSQFVDRLSESLFPGRQVELVVASTQLAEAAGTQTLPTGEPPASAQETETTFYQLPRAWFSGDQLESINQLYITDGETYVKVTFVDPSSYESAPWPSTPLLQP